MTAPHWLIVRLKNQYPMLHYFEDRTFGVEIEFYGLNYLLTPLDNGIIKPYNISSRARDGRRFKELCADSNIAIGADSDSWHFQEDTSVRGKLHTRYGAELVSPILSGIGGLVKAYQAMQFLNEIEGVNIDGSCGFHVHHGVDRDLYGCENLKELVRL
ncbi:MAG: amidoligase family protein, partial [Deltaproteobacteria bacterium]